MNIFRAANFLMTAVFLLCVAVQYNDPDPVRWMAIYSAAALACILFFTGPPRWYVTACIAGIALLWAASILSHLPVKYIAWNEVFGTMKMANETVEETRETGGLLIVAAWMLVLTIAAKRKTRVTT